MVWVFYQFLKRNPSARRSKGDHFLVLPERGLTCLLSFIGQKIRARTCRAQYISCWEESAKCAARFLIWSSESRTMDRSDPFMTGTGASLSKAGFSSSFFFSWIMLSNPPVHCCQDCLRRMRYVRTLLLTGNISIGGSKGYISGKIHTLLDNTIHIISAGYGWFWLFVSRISAYCGFFSNHLTA